MPRLRMFLLPVLWWAAFAALAQPGSNPCARHTSLRIVVLGSSTAAGAGASTPDSAWVNRYKALLQELNAGNMLYNLAVGGFTTYRIMPDGFQPPANRPLPDTSHNLSAALELQPDAILINLPSNDVASGYSLNEQLSNFDSLATLCHQHGVELWVTTTQPRTFSPAGVMLQQAVRDSLLARFGNRAIDLWTGFANAQGTLDSLYNSGDGVHLNDAGHALVAHRVCLAALPEALADTLPYTDHSLRWIEAPPAPCGDSNQTLCAEVVNLGTSGSQGLGLYFRFQDPWGTWKQDSLTALPSLPSCSADTFCFTADTWAGGAFSFRLHCASPDDSLPSNDTLWLSRSYTGHPFLLAVHDTMCPGDTVLLQAYTGSGDTIVWYADPLSALPLHFGPALFPLPPSGMPFLRFAEAVRGPLHHPASLDAGMLPNIYWNGVMFDLLADSALVVDSLWLIAGQAGSGTLRMYVRQGGHAGFEQNAAAWALHFQDTLISADTGAILSLDPPPLSLGAGDTLGVYLMFAQSTRRLGYRSLSQPIVKSGPHLALHSGSGISYAFGNAYPLRLWSGRVFYHYGFRPQGDCRSPRTAVKGILRPALPHLGPDTSITLLDSLRIGPDSSYATYAWSNGSILPQLFFPAGSLPAGIHVFGLNVTNAWGCAGSDTLVVTVSLPSGTLSTPPSGEILMACAGGLILVRFPSATSPGSALLTDLSGRIVRSASAVGEIRLSTRGLPAGIYLLMLSQGGSRRTLKVPLPLPSAGF
ncbi:MAG TPA: SGNH/GDSL hydrolase family protein [Bacteroidales bacterium]|nr:SGNH/GDSL hydrolase family protein [Bacteroidales bacterium]